MAEILKIREITIDTMQQKDFNVKEEELKLIRFYQNDLNSAKLLINVTHDKVVTDFSTATKVQIAFLKPDGKRVFQDVQNVNQMQGKYYVVLSTQTLIAYGNVIAQLRLTFPNNKVIETCKFVFAVDESIMSDEAMESTNEFSVIQKALELGEKFKNVDFDPIIAAGELAKGAVKKSGDTMTGTLNVNAPLFLNSKDGVKKYSFETDANGKLWFTEKNTPKDIFTVGTDGTFNVAGSTNLLKKTGDTMTGELRMALGKIHRFQNSDDKSVAALSVDNNGRWYNWSDVSSKRVFMYDPATDTFTIDSANTNLVKKTGGTMSGHLVFGNNKELQFKTDAGVAKASLAVDGSGNWFGWNTPGNKYLWKLDGATGEFVVNAIVNHPKDGRADLTLTADVTSTNSGYPPMAIRRGNSVTVRMEINKTGGGNVITTLPVDMRPTDQQVYTFISNDGTTPIALAIGTDGVINMFTQNKPVRINATYVVD